MLLQSLRPLTEVVRTRRNFLWVIAGALSMTAAMFAGRFGVLAFVAMVPLLAVLVRTTSPWRALGFGGLYGTLMYGATIFWIRQAAQTIPDLPVVVPWLLWAIAASQTGVAFALFAVLCCLARNRLPRVPMALLAPVMLVVAEFVVPSLFTYRIGYSLAGDPAIIQIADLAGVAGISFLLAMVNGALCDLVVALAERRPLPRVTLMAVSIVIIATLSYGQWRMAQIDAARDVAPRLRIGVVQANVGLQVMADAALAPGIRARYFDESRKLQRQGSELIIWPEAADPMPSSRNSIYHWFAPADRPNRERIEVPVLAGVLNWDITDPDPGGALRRYNSAWLVMPDGTITARYDKHIRFPLTEYIPYEVQFPWLGRIFNPVRYESGTSRTLIAHDAYRIGPMICFEDIHPEFVRALAPMQPNLLVVMGSDARFGTDPAPQQHHALAVLRSVELRRDMVRAFRTGVSSIIDANGRVLARTSTTNPGGLESVPAFGLTGTVALLEGPETIYARYGDWFSWLNTLAALMVFVCALVGTSKR